MGTSPTRLPLVFSRRKRAARYSLCLADLSVSKPLWPALDASIAFTFCIGMLFDGSLFLWGKVGCWLVSLQGGTIHRCSK
jgi:hypothetical protein